MKEEEKNIACLDADQFHFISLYILFCLKIPKDEIMKNENEKKDEFF